MKDHSHYTHIQLHTKLVEIHSHWHGHMVVGSKRTHPLVLLQRVAIVWHTFTHLGETLKTQVVEFFSCRYLVWIINKSTWMDFFIYKLLTFFFLLNVRFFFLVTIEKSHHITMIPLSSSRVPHNLNAMHYSIEYTYLLNQRCEWYKKLINLYCLFNKW